MKPAPPVTRTRIVFPPSFESAGMGRIPCVRQSFLLLTCFLDHCCRFHEFHVPVTETDIHAIEMPAGEPVLMQGCVDRKPAGFAFGTDPENPAGAGHIPEVSRRA